MRIMNAMFGRGRGGIEQAFLDYCQALKLRDHEVLAVTHPAAWVNEKLPALNVQHHAQSNRGGWDWWASRKLGAVMRNFQPDIIITHGNRALQLMARAAGDTVPVVALTHNYNNQHLRKADAVIALTRDLARHAAGCGVPQHYIYPLPNMVVVEGGKVRPGFRTPPVIGAMGRMIHKKGFDVLLSALAQLDTQGLAFHALLGGDGEEDEILRRKAAAFGLSEKVTFTGWVEDKKAFFDAIDIFCLPSRHEPFGIVLLEALASRVPVIAADAEGPREIITHERDGLLVPKNDAPALAHELARLLGDESLARSLAQEGHLKVKQRYSLPAVAEALESVLAAVCERYRTQYKQKLSGESH